MKVPALSGRLRWPIGLRDLRRSKPRRTVRDDATAGLVLGVESVPAGIATGLLAGVNPVAGLYSYLFGMVGGAVFTSSAFMSVQGTSAMAMVVSDVDLTHGGDPARSLFTLSVMTGVVMIAAGLLRLGAVMRFVSRSVMTGFITAVGINIVLGQLDNLTGYGSEGSNRVVRTIDLLTHFWQIDLAATFVGVLTIGLIVVLGKTRLGALGLVVAILVASVVAAVLDALGADVVVLADTADVPNALPGPTLPHLSEIIALAIPALSLAFVGLVQGAAVSAGVPNANGTFGDANTDFVGQGAGNVVSGVFQGMPVGGSMSASTLLVSAGAKTRMAMFLAGVVMAVVVLAFGRLVSQIALPALAGLLIVVGVQTIKPAQVESVARTGRVQLTVMVTTLGLSLLIPLQYAVLVGVGLSIVMYVLRQSSRLILKRIVISDEGYREVDPPEVIGPNDVIVVQPHGSLFFATAPMLEDQLPDLVPASQNSVVILRLRGVDEAGATTVEILSRYAATLREAGCKLVVVTDNPRILRHLRVTGALETLGAQNVYEGNEWIGRTTHRAYDDAWEWVRREE